VGIRLACPTSSVVTMVTTGMKLQLSLFFFGSLVSFPAWYIFSCEHDVIAKWQSKKGSFAYCSTNYAFNAWWVQLLPPASYNLHICGKLPGSLALLAVLSPTAPTFKVSHFYPWCHACKKSYQAFRVLCATKNGTSLGRTLLAHC